MMLQQIINVLFPAQCGGCEAAGTGLCAACLPPDSRIQRRLPTLEVEGLGAYDGRLRRAVLALKDGRRDVARAFAERLTGLTITGCALVPVPTTAARRRQRGFDGCELMAGMLSRDRAAPVLAHLVQTAGDAQRGRGRGARLSAHGRFAWRGESLNGRSITLLDDVVTTGATLEDCAAAVRAAGGIVERAIVVAVVQ